MICFLSLDTKTRNFLVQGIRSTWSPTSAEQIISYCEEMDPETVTKFVGSMMSLLAAKDPRLKALVSVSEALKGGKTKSGDWRLSPRASRKQVANAGGRKYK